MVLEDGLVVVQNREGTLGVEVVVVVQASVANVVAQGGN